MPGIAIPAPMKDRGRRQLWFRRADRPPRRSHHRGGLTLQYAIPSSMSWRKIPQVRTLFFADRRKRQPDRVGGYADAVGWPAPRSASRPRNQSGYKEFRPGCLRRSPMRQHESLPARDGTTAPARSRRAKCARSHRSAQSRIARARRCACRSLAGGETIVISDTNVSCSASRARATRWSMRST